MNQPTGGQNLAWWVFAVVLGFYVAGAAFYFGVALQAPAADAFPKSLGLLWVVGGCLLAASCAATVFPAIRATAGQPYALPRHAVWCLLFGASVGLLLGSAIPLGVRDVQSTIAYAVVRVAGLAVTPWLP